MGDCDLMRRRCTPTSRCMCTPIAPDQVLGLVPYARLPDLGSACPQHEAAKRSERNEKLEAQLEAEHKPLGFVAVAPGSGNGQDSRKPRRRCRCFGRSNHEPVHRADILDAVNKVNADSVVILPNNKNIIMAAQSLCRGFREAMRGRCPPRACRRRSLRCSASMAKLRSKKTSKP